MLFDVTFGTQQGAWQTDGTAAGTTFLSSTKLGQVIAPPPVLFRGGIYYVAGGVLWKTDAAATAAAFFPNTTATGTGTFTNVTGLSAGATRLYFTAAAGGQTALYVSDGDAHGTEFVKLLPGGAANLVTVGDVAYFLSGGSLWRSDGVPSGTGPVQPSVTYTNPRNLTPLNGTLYFETDSDLWRSDGSAAGTTRVAEIPAGSGPLVATGDQLFFYATDDAGNSQMRRTDGTAAGTLLLLSVPPYPTVVTPFIDLTPVGGALYFVGKDFHTIYRSDGTVAGTGNITSVGAGEIRQTGAHDELFYFTVSANQYFEPWRSDGTAAGTVAIAVPDGFTDAFQVATAGGTLYLDGSVPSHRQRAVGDRRGCRSGGALEFHGNRLGRRGGRPRLGRQLRGRVRVPPRAQLDRELLHHRRIAAPAPGVTRFTDTGLSSNTTYYYRLIAYNSGGDSAAATLSATTNAAPLAPSQLTAAIAGEGSVDLTWVETSGGVQSFRVERSREDSPGIVESTVTVPGPGIAAHFSRQWFGRWGDLPLPRDRDLPRRGIRRRRHVGSYAPGAGRAVQPGGGDNADRRLTDVD